jgi:hypothetical protein
MLGREMSKIVFLIIAAGLVVVAIAAIRFTDVNARQQPEFLRISVLAERQADYSVDEQVIVIPAVSVKIIEDAAQDFQTQSSVRIITYTSLPTKEPKPHDKADDDSASVEETRQDNGQGNGNNGNGNVNQNNGNGNPKEKDKGNHGGGSGNDKGKGKDGQKEDKPEKSK